MTIPGSFPPDEPGRPASSIDWPAALTEHARWMRTVVLARTAEREATEEVMQEVSLAVVESRSRPTDASKVAPWLYRLAVLQSLLYRRRRGRSRKLTDRYADRLRPTEADDRHPDALEWLLADERRRMVREALERLPPRDAEILLLKYTEDWSYHQIARHLGIGHSAVETRLFRARNRLRGELAALDVVESHR
jgi:RNA polymerase sigma-70 factor (ECF subfamily)